MNVYYVYVYLDPRKPGKFVYDEFEFDFEPFYIGKGTRSRLLRHLKNENINPIKVNKIKKIRSVGLEPIVKKIIENISNDESLKIEKRLIKSIGRYCKNEGPLTNYSEGGETYIGYKHLEEYIESLHKPVIKYDLDGNFIEEYKSIKEAGEKNDIQPQTMSQICSGKIKLHKSNFIFCYKDDTFEKRVRNKKMYPVIRIDYNNKVTNYKSATDAAADNNTTVSRINSVCMGDRFQTSGFLFRYKKHPKLDEFNKKIDNNYGKYLSILNKEIEYDNKIYRNILHVISVGKNVKINNLYNLLMNKKIYKFNEFKSTEVILQ
jgi:hypothetical protein